MALYEFKAGIIVNRLIQLCCAQSQDHIEGRGISGFFLKMETNSN